MVKSANQLQVKITNYQTLVKVYQESEASYDETVKKERQDEIIASEQDIQKFQTNATSLVQIRQNVLANPLYQLMIQALNNYSKPHLLHFPKGK